MGKDARLNTKQYSSRDIAGHTRLKYRQPGQNSQIDVARRDLKLELELAEREAAAKKRRAAGLLPLQEIEEAPKLITGAEDEEARHKRRKILEEALLADKDDSDSDEDSENEKRKQKKIGKNVDKSLEDGATNGSVNGHDDSDDDSSDDSDDDETETAELLKELEKIKRERAEEKERQVRPILTISLMQYVVPLTLL